MAATSAKKTKADQTSDPKNTAADPAAPTDELTTKPATKNDKATKDDAPSYKEQASALADDTRALVDDIREQLDDVLKRCTDLNDTEPTDRERPAADGIRRVPMSLADVKRALDGLVAVCADTSLKIGAIGDED